MGVWGCRRLAERQCPMRLSTRALAQKRTWLRVQRLDGGRDASNNAECVRDGQPSCCIDPKATLGDRCCARRGICRLEDNAAQNPCARHRVSVGDSVALLNSLLVLLCSGSNVGGGALLGK